jgi:CheY-like chemotaxis protein
LNSKTILLIEDDPSSAALTKRALERARISNSLVVAEDGLDALDYLYGTGAYAGRDITDQPVVTLMDLKLPKIPGIELLRKIREDPRSKRIPVVVLTSSNEEQDIAASYDLGINSYIRKPVDFSQFANVVEQIGLYWLLLNEPPPPKNERSRGT